MSPTDFKKRKWLWLSGAAGYCALLYLLTLAERNSPDAPIQTLSDAFWYSLVTLSTVGYGDLYPVTIPGRLLGSVFILLSLGFLASLIGFLLRMVTGRLLPPFQLWLVRGKTWYIFSCCSSAAFTLAKNLAAREPDCVLLFPASSDSIPPESLRPLMYHCPPEALAAKKKNRCHLIFLDDTDAYSRASAALAAGHPVYCRTTFHPDVCPENLTLFDPHDCWARRYWQDHGLKPEERTVLLIGDGLYAESLLTRGLMLNVFPPEQTTTYHIFGHWENYLRNHHRLAETLCLNGGDSTTDCLYFHQSPWNADAALLASADRIILCGDAPADNMEILSQLHSYFPVSGKIHLLSSGPIPCETVFGTEDTIYTPELVLQEQLTQAARTIHRIYCDGVGGNAPAWNQLTEFLRQSNIAAADHLLTKIRILLADPTIPTVTAENCRAAYARYQSCSPEQKEIFRRIEHRRWMRFHSLYNWRFASVRNNAAREHPMMVPYDALSPANQVKDDYAWELLGQLSGHPQT